MADDAARATQPAPASAHPEGSGPAAPLPRERVPEGPAPADPQALTLERYRSYLEVLALAQVDPRLRDAVDVSGVVQETFLEAHRNRDQCRGTTPEQVAGWLRQILAHNLADALRGLGRAKRDVARQVPLEQAGAMRGALDESSARLGAWLAADQSSPSQHLQRQERAVRLADALAQLPETQREALVLQYWHGWTLARIASHMGRTPAAVAGLLKRGLKGLRVLLQEQSGEEQRGTHP